jgi:histidinol-phosphate phosphatase family protein
MVRRLELRPVVFLDRDGTIIVERHYLSNPAGVELEVGVPEGLRRLSEAGYTLVVISNQSGVGRGKFGIEAAHAVNDRVAELLSAEGIIIAGWYMCPHHPNEGCNCRKPAAALAYQAARDLDLDLAHSFVIGDKRSDVEFAKAFDSMGILVTTGHGKLAVDWAVSQSIPICSNLKEASELICGIPKTGSRAIKD